MNGTTNLGRMRGHTWPLQTQTSPNKTSASATLSLPLDAVMLYVCMLALVGGSFAILCGAHMGSSKHPVVI